MRVQSAGAGGGGNPVFPVPTTGQAEGENTGTTDGTNITSGAANTKGNWYQIVASCPQARYMLILVRHSQNNRYLIDVGVGALGSESPIVSNLFAGLSTTAIVEESYLIRYDLAAGQRVSMRCQSDGASKIIICQIIFFNTADATAVGNVETLGAVTGSTDGTQVAAGATAHTKGSWVEFDASAGSDICKLILMARSHTNAGSFLMDIGTGAGEPTVLIDNIMLQSAYSTNRVTIVPIPIKINSGTRISLRCQSSVANGIAAVVLTECRA